MRGATGLLPPRIREPRVLQELLICQALEERDQLVFLFGRQRERPDAGPTTLMAMRTRAPAGGVISDDRGKSGCPAVVHVRAGDGHIAETGNAEQSGIATPSGAVPKTAVLRLSDRIERAVVL